MRNPIHIGYLITFGIATFLSMFVWSLDRTLLFFLCFLVGDIWWRQLTDNSKEVKKK